MATITCLRRLAHVTTAALHDAVASARLRSFILGNGPLRRKNKRLISVARFLIVCGLGRMLLELLHIADSALPIGATAHSFGIETLVEQENLLPEKVETFLCDYLCEAGVLEASFVGLAWQGESPVLLNNEFGARRPSRESRDAALKMGRRFALLVNALLRVSAIPDSLYYPVAFGLAAAHLQIPKNDTVLAYLRQSISGLVSACQRLMPIGQVDASCIIWNLKPAVSAAASMAGADFRIREVACFTPLPELASARHGSLETRLFIS